MNPFSNPASSSSSSNQSIYSGTHFEQPFGMFPSYSGAPWLMSGYSPAAPEQNFYSSQQSSGDWDDLSARSSGKTSGSTSQKSRSAAWTVDEEKLLIKVYKEHSEPLRKKGKKGQIMWKIIAEKLHELCKETGLDTPYRDGTKVKSKYFNLAKKYKQTKDTTRVSGEGSEEIDNCPHFEEFDEFMGSRDIISPKYVVESGASSSTGITNSTSSSTSSNTSSSTTTPKNASTASEISDDQSELLDGTDEEMETPISKRSKGKAPAKRPSSEGSTPTSRPTNKRRRKNQEDGTHEDKWLQLFQEQNEMMRESQKRENELFERLQSSEQSCKDLIVGAIRELGSLFKKD